MFTKLLTYCICKPGQLGFGESCGMHFLLKDGKGLAIINTLFCRDGSKALPEKKKFIASFLRQHGCVYVRNGRFLEFRRATRGPDLAQVRAWRGGTPGAEESTGLRSRDLDSGSSPSAHQPLGNSVCPSGKWEARLFKIFPSFFFFNLFLCVGS